MVERHRDVGAEDPLDLHRALGSEPPARPVDVALEFHAILVDLPKPLEGEHLEPPGIGEQGTVPAHEAMQSAERGDDILTGTDVQVVGVGEHEARAGGPEVGRRQRPHGSLRADRHEHRGLDDPVG